MMLMKISMFKVVDVQGHVKVDVQVDVDVDFDFDVQGVPRMRQ